jgi:hypothetical protein
MAVKKEVNSSVETESSFILRVEYGYKNRRLTVYMKKFIYNYFHVPEDVYYCLLQSKSTGQYFNKNIKNNYPSTVFGAEVQFSTDEL